MKRHVLTDEALRKRPTLFFHRVPAGDSVMFTDMAKMRAYVRYWYQIDDEEREYYISYLQMINRATKNLKRV